MSNLFWVTVIISNLAFAAANPDYSRLVRDLDKIELKSGKIQEQYDAMVSSIKYNDKAVSDLEKDISLKEQVLNSKKLFAKERIGMLLKYSAPERLDFLNALDNFQDVEMYQVLLGKMLKKDVLEYNELEKEFHLMSELKTILNSEKQKLESKSKELAYYLSELKGSIQQKKLLIQKLHSSQQGAKILADRSKRSDSKINGIVSQDGKKYISNNLQALLKGFTTPIKGRIVSPFGRSWDKYTKNWTYNRGIKIESEYGKEVLAVDSGVVSYSGWLPGYGKVLIIKHGSGVFSVYGHLSRVLLNNGGKVSKSAVVGYVGDTGSVETPSLYFEICTSAQSIDPTSLFL